LNGKSNTALIKLNTTSKVNPTIRKGSSNNQTRGNRNNITNAIGQQITKRINQSAKAINIFIGLGRD